MITAGSELVYRYSKLIDETVPVHVEVLLPAFVLGCVIAYPRDKAAAAGHPGGGHPEIETPAEQRAATIIAAAFMILVGLSMPAIPSGDTVVQDAALTADVEPTWHSAGVPSTEFLAAETGRHVLAITILSNLGKMFPAVCYRRQTHWRERLAVSIGMWPRGEVGAGVLVISLSYGIGGPIVTVAMLSLALNLLLTGPYIYIVRLLTKSLPGYE
jgi:hypothetical protein